MDDRNLLSQFLSQPQFNNNRNNNMTAASQLNLIPYNVNVNMNNINSMNNLSNATLRLSSQEGRLSRERFVVFLQILLRRLEAAQAHQLKQQAKVLVMQCTRNSKLGGATPLVASLEVHLRQLVGEAHWRTAIRATHRYFRQKEQQRLLFQLKTAQVQQVVGL